MKTLLAGAVTALIAAAAVAPAQAVPVTTSPGVLTGNGQSYAIYLFSDAADTDQLALLNFGGTTLFNNKTSASGNTVNLGSRLGTQTFTLTDTTTNPNVTFSTGIRDTVDGDFHAIYSTSYASFGVGALSSAASSALSALPAGQTVTFVGFEDRRNADYDYNDLIFAFTTQTATSVPEPSSLMILGLGLLGAGLVQRQRSRSR